MIRMHVPHLLRGTSVTRETIKHRHPTGHAVCQGSLSLSDSRWIHPQVSGNMKPYSDQYIGGLVRNRIFHDPTPDLYEWHRDRYDREIVVLESGDGWKFQKDHETPFLLYPGVEFEVKALEHHRVIPGSGTLVLQIKEDTVTL